ncbi:MAG TPA: hypothetical protein VGC37_00670 [Friedmanniella sp.]
MLAVIAYRQPGVAPADADLGDFWSWIAEGWASWDPAGTLALLAGVVLPLFLATQVGSAVSASRDESTSAQVVGLEVLTNLACWFGSVIGWLVVPAAITVGGNKLVNSLAAVFVPVFFAWLWAFSRPSQESRKLARGRTERRYNELRRICREFDSALGPIGTGRSWKHAWRPVVLEGAAVGVVLGVLLGAHRLATSGPSATGRALLDIVVSTAIFAAVHVVAVRESVEYQVTRLLDGRWTAFGMRIPATSLGFLVLASGPSALASGGLRVAFALWAFLLGPFVLVRIRMRSHVLQEIVYHTVRARGAYIVRACRSAEPRISVTPTRGKFVTKP